MKCPYCMAHDSKVVDKRDSDVSSTRRRRECLSCRRRFTTYERVELVELTVVKKDGRREAFNPEKLRGGILRACEKRPVTRAQIDEMIESIEAEIRARGEPELSSHLLGELSMARLRTVDQVAYIRFASVYRSFTDIESFSQEVQGLLHGNVEAGSWKLGARVEN